MGQIIREEGILTLYTGLASELVKTSVQNFSYFFWYIVFKEAATERFGSGPQDKSTSEASLTPSDEHDFKQNALLASQADARSDLARHQALCTDNGCFCRSVGHLAAHTEAHKQRTSQVDLWRSKAEAHRRKVSMARRAAVAQDFDANAFHPRLMPSVSEPHLAGLTTSKHDFDDSPYVDVRSADQTGLVTNTATVLPSASPQPSATSVAVVSPPPPQKQLSIGATLLLGTLAGCITQLVVNPVSVIQTRMMTQKKTSASGIAQLGFFALASNILRDEGVSAFFAGILPSFILSTNPSIQFLVFDRLKSLILRILSQSMLEPRSLSIFESFILGAFSKIVATLVTYPYIMAKIRLQYKGDGGSSPAVVYKGTLDVIFRTLKYEGISGLFTGLQAQLLKSVLGAALVSTRDMKCEQYCVTPQSLQLKACSHSCVSICCSFLL
jgi:hypothetical protein